MYFVYAAGIDYNMAMSGRVFIAMSGGIDSSAAACILKEAGYEVCGVHFTVEYAVSTQEKSAVEQICRLLDIPLYCIDISSEFSEKIVDYFCYEYQRGRTPNPCIRCNKTIKFGFLLEKIKEMGGDYLATGHYARIDRIDSGYRLLKGIDKKKDQSYFLYQLTQRELAHVLFPVGEMSKDAVKSKVLELGVSLHRSRESQDICFIPDNDSRTFLMERSDCTPGEIVDIKGKVLGSHKGLPLYTIGQRQGMGISSIEPLYVVSIDAVNNRLIVGHETDLYRNKLTAENVNWISGDVPCVPQRITAKIRYGSPEKPAVVYITGKHAEVVFDEPQKAAAPGQSVVFYNDEEVLGGGIIEGAY
jgi:tRNA-uridine 2-sulfurtransferase